jgi:hypothetical protein
MSLISASHEYQVWGMMKETGDYGVDLRITFTWILNEER